MRKNGHDRMSRQRWRRVQLEQFLDWLFDAAPPTQTHGELVVCQMLVFGSGYEGGHRLESVKAKNN